MPETTPLIKAALNLRAGAGFDVYVCSHYIILEYLRKDRCEKEELLLFSSIGVCDANCNEWICSSGSFSRKSI